MNSTRSGAVPTLQGKSGPLDLRCVVSFADWKWAEYSGFHSRKAGDVALFSLCRNWIAHPCTLHDRAISIEGCGDNIGFMEEVGTLTYADLETIPDDGLRRELLDGELIVTPSPRVRHQDLAGDLFVLFKNHLAAHGGGRAFIAPLDIILSDRNVVEPDMIFVAADQAQLITEKNIQGAPALLIEVLSNPRIDRVRKRDIYERFGIAEYWVVDPDADRIEVHQLRDGRYGKPAIFEPGDVLSYERLPGLSIDLRALLAR